jgi:nucleoside-diphosphate-sugar epimerase
VLVVAASKRHVVLGAAGATGSAVVGELAARGWRVRAVTRRGTGEVPEGVEQVAADIATAEGARRACEGAAVVYHCAQPDYRKWPELFPPMTKAVLEGAAEAGAKLVFADNLYVYGPPDGPMSEETPQRAEGRKGRTRIEMADAVLRAHADGRLRTTIGRCSDYYGPRGTGTTAGDNIMKPALRGKRTRWLGSLDQPHTLNYLEDMGRAYVTLGERGEADGQVWHLPAAEPLTGRQFLELVFEEAGHSPKIGVASRPAIRMVGLFNPLVRELNETLYQFERPFVVDASKFQRAFGPFETTPHQEAVRRTVAWFRRHYGV